jgi:hypothetical protein
MFDDHDFLYRFEARIDATPIGLVPEGLRMTIAFDGHVTDGLWVGARIRGIDPLVIRPDGVGVIDAPKTITLDGRSIFEHLRGFCVPPAGLALPSLDELVKPDFEWPEEPFDIYGVSTFATSEPSLAHLNRSMAIIRGRASFATGKLEVETRLLVPETPARPARPARPRPETGAWA